MVIVSPRAQEEGGQSPTVLQKDVLSERFALLSLALGTKRTTNWSAQSQYNGLSNYILLTCVGIESVLPKTA